MENQKRISVTETKLTPRQRPQMPPKLEMKSSQVILGDLSNSANSLGVDDNCCKLFGTQYCRASKIDVDQCNVLFICIVQLVSLVSTFS